MKTYLIATRPVRGRGRDAMAPDAHTRPGAAEWRVDKAGNVRSLGLREILTLILRGKLRRTVQNN